MYDMRTDAYITSRRMATLEKIARIGAEAVPGTERAIDAALVDDGLTEKDFDPDRRPQTPQEREREEAAAAPLVFEDS
jgi:hypothetical protein